MTKIVEVDGEKMYESDRNLDPPYYVYPNDLVACAILKLAKNNRIRESKITAVLLQRLVKNPKFEVRTTVSDIHAVFDSMRMMGYAFSWSNVYITVNGRQYCKDRLANFYKLKPNAAKALEDQLDLELESPSNEGGCTVF